jgi:creatinine amidohydrolase
MRTSILDDTMVVMSWVQIARSASDGDIVLWPVSVLEEHGPHMAIVVDICIGCVLSRLIQENLSQDRIRAVIAPPNYWGINNVTGAFPGSFTLRRETFKALLYDTLASLKRWGFEHIFILDLHGDVSHRGALLEGIIEARIGCGIRAVAIVPYRYARYVGLTGKEPYLLIQPQDANPIPFSAFTEHQDIHAGALETSFMQRYFPEQVDIERARELKPTVFRPEDWSRWASGWSDARGVVPDGYNGDPASINPELAEAWIAAEAQSIARLIRSYLAGTYEAPVVK